MPRKRIKVAQANGSIRFSSNIFGAQGHPTSNPATDAEPQWQGVAREKPAGSE